MMEWSHWIMFIIWAGLFYMLGRLFPQPAQMLGLP